MESALIFLGYNLPVWVVYLSAVLLSFCITYVSIPTIVQVSLLKKLIDYPNERTSHEKSVPTLGGMAIFSGFLLSVLLFSHPEDSFELRYLIGACLVLFFTGLKDDILIIDPKKKLVSQVIAAFLLVVLGDIRITDFHSILGIDSISYLSSVLFSILLIVGLVNGFNLIDGVDGLSAGIGIINSIAFGIWFIISKDITGAVMGFALAGSLVSYFIFNVFGKKNKIFMGDTGSMLTGLIVAVLTIKFLETNSELHTYFTFKTTPSLALGLLILPIFDTIRVSVLRVVNGRSPFSADKNHIHHSFLKLGFNHFQTTMILMAVTLIYVIAVCLFQPANTLLFLIIMLLVTGGLSVLLDLSVRRKNPGNQDPA